ncbi:homing endonuclease associated repeat-containing protein [Natronorubrum sp. A-ect3]|uniref:homing endonuclease associated repeat-containing protein n=1 Tax=Natronorubrum sp. A-ect3 TaxID=3242698 RepID=UPI00359DDED9
MGTDDSERAHTRGYTETALTKHLRAVNDAYQQLPTIADLEKYNDEYDPEITPHPQTYISRFGSWTTALETTFPDAELCRELWRVANQLDRRPYQDDLDGHGRFGSRAYQQRFGSWEAALEAAEFDPSVRIPDEFLIDDLWRVALLDKTDSETKENEKRQLFSTIDGRWSLSVEKLQQHGKYSYHTYIQRLGGSRGGLIGAEQQAGLRGSLIDF